MSVELFDILTFDHVVVELVDITTTDPTWTDLMTLTTPVRDPGFYALVFSLQFVHASTSNAFLYRFSHDGGGSWGPAYEKEVKDKHNTEVIELLDFRQLTAAEVIDMRCQVTREGSADCEVLRGIITCERKV